MTFVCAVAAGLVCVGAAFAHAASAPLSKQQVIVRGSVICEAAERRVLALPQVRSQDPFAPTAPKGDRERALAFLAGYADALASVRKGISALPAPARGRQLLTGFVAGLEPAIAKLREARRDAMAGRFDAAKTAAAAGFAAFAKAGRLTAAYGFPKGVCQP